VVPAAQDGRRDRRRPLLPRHPGVVHRRLRGGDGGPARGLGGHRRRRPHAGGGADRVRQDAGGVPVVARPAGRRAGAGGPQGALPGALHQPAQGAGRGRRAQPAVAAGRDPAGGDPARAPAAGRPGRAAVRGHLGRGAPAAGPAPAGHPHHHARVAVPHADQRRPGHPARRADRDHRRGPRGLLDQARRPPRAHPGAAGRAAGAAGAAGRAVGDGAPGRGGRPLPGRRPGRHGRAAGDHEDRRAQGGRAGRGHVPAGRADRGGPGVRGGGGEADLDLAGGRGAGARPGRAAPLDDRVRQLPPAGRAADRPAQRAGLRAEVRGERTGSLGVRRRRCRQCRRCRRCGRARGGWGRR
ncbi:MAG: putative ATP-dependent DNA helicase, partial [uncultured Corynebacteriales bacterium]